VAFFCEHLSRVFCKAGAEKCFRANNGNRYYGGCEWVDVAETLAIDRAKKLFGAGFSSMRGPR
jgi:glycine/serine hydroxymethyltransferase